jgi:S-adenosylmethionine-diacylglycerol 3-amino-3-carboxypropyl transferase
MAILEWVSQRVFSTVHGNNLVYNTCWEDPRLDRVALAMNPSDNVLVITSAGCNALDYALAGAQHVYAVDMNPRQNALLELKIVAIQNLDYRDFFRMFGEGRLSGARNCYRYQLRNELSPWARRFWDKRIGWFDNPKKSFYFRGTSGIVARFVKVYTDHVIRVRPHLDALLNAQTLDEQCEIYERYLRKQFWSTFIKFAVKRDTTMSLLGVPKAQRRQIETQYQGGLLQFVQDCMESVMVKLPLKDNYFWRVYLNGAYTPSCCPEYLRESNFERLRTDCLNRVTTHTDSVQGFLEKQSVAISRFVLLDHMDWMSDRHFPLLEAEWQAILDRSTPDARFIWRSGGLRTDYLDQVEVVYEGRIKKLRELLVYEPELAAQLHPLDRVHTYGSFYIARRSF